MTEYQYLADERAVRAEALHAAATAAHPAAKHMRHSSGTYTPLRKFSEGTIVGAVRKVWSGNTDDPASATEGVWNEFGDFVLRAAQWIVTGQDPEVVGDDE